MKPAAQIAETQVDKFLRTQSDEIEDNDEDYADLPELDDHYASDSDSDDDLDSFFEDIDEDSDLDSDINQESNEIGSCRFQMPGRKVGSSKFQILTKARALETVKALVAEEVAEQRKNKRRLPKGVFTKLFTSTQGTYPSSSK